MRAFGSAAQAIAAPDSQLLLAVEGNTLAVSAIAAFRADLNHVLTSRLDRRPILAARNDLLDYLRFDMAFRSTEQVRALHLTSSSRLIRDEVVGEGTIDEAPVYVREVLRRALELGSAGLILVHNHPSGDPEPSRADRDITRRIAAAGQAMGVALLDHVIVAASGTVSFHAEGLLR